MVCGSFLNLARGAPGELSGMLVNAWAEAAGVLSAQQPDA